MAWFLSYYETNAHFKTGLRLRFPPVRNNARALPPALLCAKPWPAELVTPAAVHGVVKVLLRAESCILNERTQPFHGVSACAHTVGSGAAGCGGVSAPEVQHK